MAPNKKPLILITGASGRIGGKLIARLQPGYRIVGLDIKADADGPVPILECDLSSDESVSAAIAAVKAEHGEAIAAVVHLAAFFDFTGEDKPLYETVNIEGTRRLVRALRDAEVERFVYASTMLVHAPTEPGVLISENDPIAPRWAYPQSKAEAEAVIAEEAGDMPYTLLRLAGVYDEESLVPTLAQQIARIYERDFQSALYAGDLRAGQSFLHSEDMAEAVARTVDRRKELPARGAILIGEPGALGYQRLQSIIGGAVHGEGRWRTLALPKSIAKIGAIAQRKAEPIIPDSIDQGETPFIRPFMIEMASDHYALDVTHAHELLDWHPHHRLEDVIPGIVERLKADPMAWYERNGVTPPPWMQTAAERGADPEAVRSGHEADFRTQHRRFLWAHFANIFLGVWLLTSPAILGYTQAPMIWSDVLAGLALIGLSVASLNWRLSIARLGVGIVALWVLFAPLLFWTPSAAAYLNGTAIGALALGLAVVTRPFPLISPIATQTGPDIPPGWDFSPSTFMQRAPIIGLAVIGFFISRYLTAYQLGHVNGIWDPFFSGPPESGRNGSEYITTSEMSEAWPVPDAGLGAAVYILEIITGLIGSARRWRTMPWLVVLFGMLIVPLGIVSITFIIIQPILLGTWCLLCLIAAAAMVIQIPYSVDELVATGQFLKRKHKQGALARAFIFGDTDEGENRDRDDFDKSPREMLASMAGGVTVTWQLAASMAIGVWLMFTRLTFGAEGAMANADHLIGSLVIVVAATALAETTRAARFLNMALGAALLITPFMLGAGLVHLLASIVAGLALMALSVPRGRIENRYAGWDRYII